MRQKMKIPTVVFVFICLLLLSSCGAFSGGNAGPSINPDLHVGTEGLEIEFIQENSPGIAYENKPVPLILRLQNKGANDITYGWYTIGAENKYIDLQDEGVKSFTLDGRSPMDQLGEPQILKPKVYAKLLPSGDKTAKTTITITTCYAYQTDASTDVCVDTDVYGLGEYEKVCEPETTALGGGQGGPIGVTQVKTEILPHEEESKAMPQFIVDIANLGSGQAIVPNAVDTACSSRSMNQNSFNIIEVSASLYEYELDCLPKLEQVINESAQVRHDSSATTQAQDPQSKKGYTKLKQNKGRVVCSLPEGIEKSRGTYNSPLRIELKYGYSQTIAKEITIRKTTAGIEALEDAT